MKLQPNGTCGDEHYDVVLPFGQVTCTSIELERVVLEQTVDLISRHACLPVYLVVPRQQTMFPSTIAVTGVANPLLQSDLVPSGEMTRIGGFLERILSDGFLARTVSQLRRLLPDNFW